MTQYINIKKVADHQGTEKTPTHVLEVKNDKEGKGYTVGSLWTREGASGKFLSGMLKDDYTDKEGKQYSGYVVITKKEYSDLLLAQKQLQGLKLDKPVQTGGYEGDIFDGSVIDDSKIDF